MKRTADRLFGDKFVWSVLGAGATSCPIARWRRGWRQHRSGLRIRYGLRPGRWPRPMRSR